ncbi:MAG: glycosyltransferase family 39 protein [Deltaproteobacteria bacterium]|jgi:hypothetical protein|nr:glycosyltransferase family 39 protein [Deltaproteobacteria bacterium]MBW2533629.1 glycosyltransferase family 39 protein [Deltaproteobacteria bacterium]
MPRSPLWTAWRSCKAALRAADPFDLGSYVLFGVVALLVVTTFGDYGVTWDEHFHIDYGDRILAYFASGLSDRSALTYPGGQQPTYGGAFDLLGAVVRTHSPFDAFDTMHLVGGLVGIVGIVGAWKLGRLLMGPAGGFCSALLLTITPAFYCTMFNNPKDPPFAVGYVWALYGLCALAHELPRPRLRRWVIAALCMGAAMCVRVAGIITIGYLVALVMAYAGLRGRAAGSLMTALRTLRSLLPKTLATCGAAWAVMIAPWPWAQQDPFQRPLAALSIVSDYNLFVDRRPFGEQIISTFAPPWDYLPRYFVLQLPEVVLVLVLVGAFWATYTLARRRASLGRMTEVSSFALLAAAIAVPPAYALAQGSALYDGLRHFLFLTPPIAVAAGCTAVAVTRWLRLRRRSLAWLAPATLGLASLHQALLMSHLHPHEYVYFNWIAGGLPGALDRYDTDYYGSSYSEAFACLDRYLWQHERNGYLHRTHRVSGCVADRAARHYLAPHFEWLGFSKRKEADFFLAYRRNDCHRHGQGHPVVCRVERFGTVLAEVYDIRTSKR